MSEFYVKKYRTRNVLARDWEPGEVTASNALDHSIDKWEFMVAWLEQNPYDLLGDGADDSCALCISTRSQAEPLFDCGQCLIYHNTGRTCCDGTPYVEYARSYRSGAVESLLPAAKGMVMYLKALREMYCFE